MIIRSQDGKRLFNFKSISSICIIGRVNGASIQEHLVGPWGEDGGYVVQIDHFHAGVYSSEEKAIKVLDAIQEDHIRPSYMENHSGSHRAFSYVHKVFQMPQDGDVEG